MGIMTRVFKIFKADIHGVMDQLEDQELLLKQHMREMAESLNLKESGLNQMLASRKQARQDFDNYKQQIAALEQDLGVAIEKNKDDIARMLIRKIKPLSNLQDQLAGRIRDLEEEISLSQDQLDQQRIRYAQLRQKSIAFFQKSRMRKGQTDLTDLFTPDQGGDLSDEEIELELLKRKEALGA